MTRFEMITLINNNGAASAHRTLITNERLQRQYEVECDSLEDGSTYTTQKNELISKAALTSMVVNFWFDEN